MPTAKKPSAKKASAKKATAKKAAAKKSSAVTLEGGPAKLRINFRLDEKKMADIKRCLAKGKLSVTLTRVDLAAGRAGDPWLYD